MTAVTAVREGAGIAIATGAAIAKEISLCDSLVTIRAFHDVTDAFYQTEFQRPCPGWRRWIKTGKFIGKKCLHYTGNCGIISQLVRILCPHGKKAVRCRDAFAPSGIERLYEERIRLWIWSKFSARST